MDFNKICMLFTMQEPFYGILLSAMNRIEEKKVTTLGVRRSGGVFCLGYNPDFVNKFNLDTVIELLKHETLHIALEHFNLWDEESLTPEIHKLRNIAEDLEINCYLNRNKMDPNVGGCWVEDFGFPPHLGAREYFKLLCKKREEEKQKMTAKNPTMPCNGGQGGKDKSENQKQNRQSQQDGGEPQQQNGQQTPENAGGTGNQENKDSVLNVTMFDDHSQWPKGGTDTEKEELKEAVESLLVMAAEETEKTCGSVPSFIQQKLEKLKKKPRPVTDWRKHFRRYLGNQFTDLMKRSRKRQSKRFPDAPGTRHQRKSHILVGIDTSGSINMKDYKEFMGQIRTLAEKATFRVIECDSKIQHEYEFNGIIPDTVHGGGGTSFAPVIDRFLENRKLYDSIVYFTDGCANIPKNTPKETLWVISSDGNKNKEKYKVNGASVIFIKPIVK